MTTSLSARIFSFKISHYSNKKYFLDKYNAVSNILCILGYINNTNIKINNFRSTILERHGYDYGIIIIHPKLFNSSNVTLLCLKIDAHGVNGATALQSNEKYNILEIKYQVKKIVE